MDAKTYQLLGWCFVIVAFFLCLTIIGIIPGILFGAFGVALIFIGKKRRPIPYPIKF
jgi:hypothetical protein